MDWKGIRMNWKALKWTKMYCELFTKQLRLLKPMGRTLFENIVGKGENAVLYHSDDKIAQFEPQWNCRLQILLIWTSVKFCRLVKS